VDRLVGEIFGTWIRLFEKYQAPNKKAALRDTAAFFVGFAKKAT